MIVGPALRPARDSRRWAHRLRCLVRRRVGLRADSSLELEPPSRRGAGGERSGMLEPPLGGGAGERYTGPFGPERSTAALGRMLSPGKRSIPS